MKAYPYLIQGNNIVVVIDNKSHTINKTHVTYEKVKEAIKAGKWDLLKDIIEPKKVVLNYGMGNVSVQGETLFWRGKEMHTALATRMIAMLQEGFPIEPMVNFMERLMKNPSARAVKELYGFLEAGNMPITPDGCFLAYKKVGGDYYDVHSGTVLNKPYEKLTAEDREVLRTKVFGKKKEVTVEIVAGVTTVSMARNEVNDNKDETCSEGLHFCSEGYLGSFGGERIVVLKIDPADVVSIPSDYKDTKGRTCKYQVIGEVGIDATNATEFSKAVQSNALSATPKAAPVVPKGPKTGATAFYRGYEAGYRAAGFAPGANITRKEYHDYDEGFIKGQHDRLINETPRYKYEVVKTTSWPAPRRY